MTITPNVVSVGIGVAGLMVAAWQTIRERNTRDMYREKCVTRCRDLVETARELATATSYACKIKDEHFDNLISANPAATRPLRQLSDQIHAIFVTENQLERFCERLNQEHQHEFKSPIFKDIKCSIHQNCDSEALQKEALKAHA